LIVNNDVNNQFDADLYDHIVEGGLKVDSGLIQFLDCPASSLQLEILVEPGNYRLRVHFLNMAGYDSDEEESNDYYKIEIWPDSNIERKVLKRYRRDI
jgi:hypothetical protein